MWHVLQLALFCYRYKGLGCRRSLGCGRSEVDVWSVKCWVLCDDVSTRETASVRRVDPCREICRLVTVWLHEVRCTRSMANTAVSVQSQSFERCSTAHSYYKGSVSSVSKLSACGREDNLTPRMFLDRYSLPRVVKIVPQVRNLLQLQIRLFTHFFIPNLLTTYSSIQFGIIIWYSTVL